MTKSEKIDKILPALAKVKAELQAVTKGAKNPFFKSKYADLNTHLEAVEPLLEKNKLILLQPASISNNENTVVESIILDVESGQYVSSSMRLVGDTKMQDAGSAITYARRYTLGTLLSMKAEDDDGEASMGRNNVAPKEVKTVTRTEKAEAAAPEKKSSFKNRKNVVAKNTSANNVQETSAPVVDNGSDI